MACTNTTGIPAFSVMQSRFLLNISKSVTSGKSEAFIFYAKAVIHANNNSTFSIGNLPSLPLFPFLSISFIPSLPRSFLSYSFFFPILTKLRILDIGNIVAQVAKSGEVASNSKSEATTENSPKYPLSGSGNFLRQSADLNNDGETSVYLFARREEKRARKRGKRGGGRGNKRGRKRGRQRAQKFVFIEIDITFHIPLSCPSYLLFWM